MSYKRLLEIFAELKAEGITRDEAPDYLEVDFDQEVDPVDIEDALYKIYGAKR